MVILHIIAPGDVGGAERVVQTLAGGHREQGHRVAVVAVMDEERPDHPFLTPLRDLDVEVHSVIVPSRRYLQERSEVARVLRQIEPDIVHTHGYRCDVVSSGAARALGIPTVTTVHGFTGGGLKNHFYEWLQRRAFRQFDAVVAVATTQVEGLVRSRVSRDRIHVVRNAWTGAEAGLDRQESRRLLDVPEGMFHLGWVGRLEREKGLDVMLDALTRIADLNPLLSVVGDGRERDRLREYSSKNNLDGSVRWHGAVPEASRFFTSFDCFVNSSRTEGTPMVVFEAMAAGAPIVATSVGGVPDVVSVSEALLVPPEDPNALAEAIRAVHDQPEEAKRRCSAARARLEAEFAVEPWLAKHEELYLRIGQVSRRGAEG
jgi:glycosyltransferase involved in cell wall biosynthesis